MDASDGCHIHRLLAGSISKRGSAEPSGLACAVASGNG